MEYCWYYCSIFTGMLHVTVVTYYFLVGFLFFSISSKHLLLFVIFFLEIYYLLHTRFNEKNILYMYTCGWKIVIMYLMKHTMVLGENLVIVLCRITIHRNNHHFIIFRLWISLSIYIIFSTMYIFHQIYVFVFPTFTRET